MASRTMTYYEALVRTCVGHTQHCAALLVLTRTLPVTAAGRITHRQPGRHSSRTCRSSAPRRTLVC